MRAGNLKVKRYKAQRGGRGWLILLLLLAIGGGLYIWYQDGSLPLPIAPAPTLTPEDAKADERTLTLPAQNWYALQLGVFEQQSSAKALAESYQGRGAAGFIDDRENYRVLAAAYESRADAQAVQQQLRQNHGVEAYILALQSPEITLHLTGQKAQLTALSDAFDALHQTAGQLSNLSLALDQRQIGRDELLSSLASQQETLSALEKRLHTLFGDSPHPAVQPILSALAELSKGLEAAQQASGETRLGAQVKYCQLLCIVRLAQYGEEISP